MILEESLMLVQFLNTFFLALFYFPTQGFTFSIIFVNLGKPICFSFAALRAGLPRVPRDQPPRLGGGPPGMGRLRERSFVYLFRTFCGTLRF